MIPDHTLPLDELPVGCVNSHFLDSGAFAMWSLSQKYAEENSCDRWEYYRTDEFKQYLHDYAEFVKKNKSWIDLCANVDVIGNPELTWKNQRRLEKLGIKPVPVVHYGTDLKWLQLYVDRGYDLIGLGGLVGSTGEEDCKRWIDRCFQLVCGKTGLPSVKIHGFGVTSYRLLITYPWYSVDSTSWTKVGAFGGILVPHKRSGRWDFSEDPYLVKVSEDSPDRKREGKHLLTMSTAERKIVTEWLDYIGVPLGKQDKTEVLEWGVTTHHTYRKAANLFFFEELRKWLPDYPWKFRSKKQKGFGLT